MELSELPCACMSAVHCEMKILAENERDLNGTTINKPGHLFQVNPANSATINRSHGFEAAP